MIKHTVTKVNELCVKNKLKRPLLIGVTLLTSLDINYLREYKINFDTVDDYVLYLAKKANDAGLDGVVASPKETILIKQTLGKDFSP